MVNHAETKELDKTSVTEEKTLIPSRSEGNENALLPSKNNPQTALSQ